MEHKTNYELKKHTTFKIGGTADNVFFPETEEEFIDLLKEKDNPVILGSCSNILISSSGTDRNIIITSKMTSHTFEENKLHTACGTKGPLLSKKCGELGLTGFEFMIGFPGSIGGMLCMNASAHNQAISDSFVGCKVFDLDKKEILNLNKEDMIFEYRKSVFAKKNYILISADFEFSKTEKENISERMNMNLDFRKSKQPSLALPNVGSIFKNPKDNSAGRLLDEAGVKGLQVGGAKVWENHANFIVNFNDANSKDVLNLMLKMYDIVKNKHEIELQPEIKYLGNLDKEEERIWKLLNQENTQKTQI